MADEKKEGESSLKTLRTAITRKVFGEEAAKLDADARQAAIEGHLIDSTKLGLQGMVAGAAYVANSLGDPIRHLVAGGESVSTHGGAPTTPPKSTPKTKGAPER